VTIAAPGAGVKARRAGNEPRTADFRAENWKAKGGADGDGKENGGDSQDGLGRAARGIAARRLESAASGTKEVVFIRMKFCGIPHAGSGWLNACFG